MAPPLSTPRPARTNKVRGAMIAALALTAAALGATGMASAAPAGAGFDIQVSDVKFILQQIRIAERHRAVERSTTTCTGTPLTVANCATPNTNILVPGSLNTADITDARQMLGLRQVDGRNNNLTTGFAQWNGVGYGQQTGTSWWGAADTPFPRDTPEKWRAGLSTAAWPTGCGAGTFPCFTTSPKSSYDPAQRPGQLIDPAPREISNLVADQSSCNPAAAQSAGLTPPVPCNPNTSYEVPNTAPNNGVGAASNGMFTLFGQFFDHGLDLVGKTDQQVVVIPLKEDDPLYRPGASTNFMVLNRTVLDANNAGNNSTTPWIDQNQTYTSHPSHQVFLREYGCGIATNNAAATRCSTATNNRPVVSGRLLDGTIANNIGTWADVKQQALLKLGIALSDYDATNVPLLATDEYGRFLRGPNGFPMLVRTNGTLLEGNPAANSNAGVPTVDFTQSAPGGVGPLDLVQRTGHAFLDDIAHGAAPAWAFDGSRWVARHNTASLAQHFITGDGRGNENIGLTSVHTIFHSEHNRVVDQIKSVISSAEATTAGTATFAFADFRACPTQGTPSAPNTGCTLSATSAWNGERLMQAARFVTEMEYQHLVFGEFARRVQPLVRPFAAYDPTLNPNITAEFAHAVYRFGHSQLNEVLARRAADGSDTSLPLIDAFLSPGKFNQGGLDGSQAAGQVVRGMSGQVANEIDEFVTGALRNNLLGLPLDLGTLNIARGRDTGMESLNGTRRALFAKTNGDTSLQPYASWVDFGLGLRHPGSLVNFVAAYGTHPSITTATTVAAKRAAANCLVNAVCAATAPADRGAFMTSQGAWAPDPDTGLVPTGIEDIDLWIGGLAEQRAAFGGLLGSTFDQVFRQQMENLQEGDRLYYLGRLAGLNLSTQIETNTFAEIIRRNTDVDAIPNLAFDMPQKIFNQTKSAATYPEIIVQGDGTWRYGGAAHSVFEGQDTTFTAGDGQWGGTGNDTLRGNGGKDTLVGDGGDDNLIGGADDDVITDSSGTDLVIGGSGRDYMATGGTGLDAFNGGADTDFSVGGGFGHVLLAGPGNDFGLGGAAADTMSGDDGSDWLEGGSGSDTLSGDIVAPFGLDVTPPGDDVLSGDSGNNITDGGGAMDIFVGGGPGTNTRLGGLGFDWTTYFNPRAMNARTADLTLVAPAPADVAAGFADTFLDAEALSGGALNDTLSGDIRTTLAVVGTPNGDSLISTDIPKITGLSTLLLQAGGNARTSLTNGDILIGGGGSDRLQGRQGNEVIDGDAYLRVNLSVPKVAGIIGTTIPDPDAPTTRVLVDSMVQISELIRTRKIAMADVLVRKRIVWDPHGTELDAAVYNNPRANYTITPATSTAGGPALTITDATNGGNNEGTDTVRRVERLVFSDQTVNVQAPDAPAAPTASATSTTALSASWVAPGVGGSIYPVTGYTARAWRAATGTSVAPVATCTTTGATTCAMSTGLAAGEVYYVGVTAASSGGESVESPRVQVTMQGTAAIPSQPAIPTISYPQSATAGVSWTAPAANGSAIISYTARAWTASLGGTVAGQCTVSAPTVTCPINFGLSNGTTYYVDVVATNGVGDSLASPRAAAQPVGLPGTVTQVTPSYPSASTIRIDFAGAPSNGSTITSYQVKTYNSAGVAQAPVCTAAAADRWCELTGVTAGTTYFVGVSAVANTGTGPESSPRVSATTGGLAGQPTGVTATTKPEGLQVSWAAPSDGGSTITSYTVTSYDSGGALRSGTGTSCLTTATPPATPVRTCMLTGLPDGTAGKVAVTASNSAGDGPSSAQLAATWSKIPFAPSGVKMSYPGSGQAKVVWNAADPNGHTISRYDVRTYTAAGAPLSPTCGATAMTGSEWTCTLTSLAAGTTYMVGVTATSDAGVGEQSPMMAATAAGVPFTPSGVGVTYPASGQATVTWVAPSGNGSAITGYTTRAWSAASGGTVPAATCTSSTATCTFPTLTNGTTYYMDVVATNAMGDSAPSTPRLAATPRAAPSAPQNVAVSYPVSSQVAVSWTAPATTGGVAISGYTVRVYETAAGGTPLAPTCSTTSALTCTLTGLTAGTQYWIGVSATNGVAGPEAALVPATPVLIPGAPGGVSVSYPAFGQVAVGWTPAPTNGSTINAYTVRAWNLSSGGAIQQSCTLNIPDPANPPPLTCTLGTQTALLTNGTSYYIDVVASAGAVNGPASSPRTTAVPRALSTEPTNVQATSPGSQQIQVTWGAPLLNGGTAIAGYTARAWTAATGGTSAGVCSWTTGTLACTIGGLTNGTTYYVDVTATNGTGFAGPASSPRVARAPYTVPNAPTGVGATYPAANQIVMGWAAPADDGGSAITSYTARVFDALSGGNELTGSACTVAVPDPANPPVLSCTLGGSLTPGTSYFVDVGATNARGTGAASSPRVEVIPRTTPGTPGNFATSYPASGQVAASWSAASAGGAPMADMSYTLRVWANNTRSGTPVKECTTPILTCGVGGLVNGTTYFADVIASNGFTGTASALVAVTPRTTPGTPTSVTGEYPSAGAVLMRWAAPASDGGSPITAYTARVWTASTGGTELTASNCSTTGATTFTCTLQGTLTVGTTYYVALEAANAAGSGTPSARVAVIPRSLPGAPTNVSVTAPTTAATLAVTWTAPTNTGGVPLTGYTARAYTTSTGTTVQSSCTAAPGTTTCTITTGLASRTRYYVAVRAQNPLPGPDSTRFTAPNTR